MRNCFICNNGSVTRCLIIQFIIKILDVVKTWNKKILRGNSEIEDGLHDEMYDSNSETENEIIKNEKEITDENDNIKQKKKV